VQLTASQKRRLTVWLCIVGFGAVAGYFYTAMFYTGSEDVAVHPWRGARAGMLIAALAGGFELFAMRSALGAWLRRLPYIAGFSLRVLIQTSLVVGCLALNYTISNAMSAEPLPGYHLEDLADDTAFSLVAMTFALLSVELVRYLGARNLLRIFTGQYRRPIREERIFAIFDVAGSSEAASRLSDERFHEYLSSIFFDIDQPIVDFGGEIHSYVGDAVFAVWPLPGPNRRSDVVLAIKAVWEKIAQRRSMYEREFGLKPRLRAAVHCGSVVAGQTGDSKRQVTYLGETVNIVARIGALAKTLGRDILVSQAAHERFELPEGGVAHDEGEHPLKGVAEPVRLFSLSLGPLNK
jgi:adenylate cyclase